MRLRVPYVVPAVLAGIASSISGSAHAQVPIATALQVGYIVLIETTAQPARIKLCRVVAVSGDSVSCGALLHAPRRVRFAEIESVQTPGGHDRASARNGYLTVGVITGSLIAAGLFVPSLGASVVFYVGAASIAYLGFDAVQVAANEPGTVLYRRPKPPPAAVPAPQAESSSPGPPRAAGGSQS